MFIEASDHVCPVRSEARRAETARAAASAVRAGCPAGAQRAGQEPARTAAPGVGIGGWWAFCTQAGTAEARA